MDKQILIGLAGPAFSGKDTFAEAVQKTEEDVHIYAMALPLKLGAMALFGFSHAQVFTPEGKEEIDPIWGKSPRYFLQDLGTEVFRDRYGPDFWIKRAEKELQAVRNKIVIITDIRFENEAAWVRSRGGTVIHIRRPGVAPTRVHRSEIGISCGEDDIVIMNDRSLDEFKKSAQFCFATLE